jgi:anthranilate/para-aminobenzoate synthase component I
MFYDHMREQAWLYLYDFLNTTVPAAEVVRQRLQDISSHQPTSRSNTVRSPACKLQSNTRRETFMAAVDEAREQMRQGEFFEVVLSHSYTGQYARNPFEFYRRFRAINPSPYLFYVNYCDEVLVGASPEMFVRVKDGVVQVRPISGTALRGADSISDYHSMMRLLTSEKEKAELDMLVDLARNDISRVCEPSVAVSDYRCVEKYSRVMHTVAHVEGRLMPTLTAFDAFIACLNAGTLTGAPKAAAMAYIENKEPNRRGYYGGNVGYLTFSGQIDTGIIIRTAHFERHPQGDQNIYDVNVRAGATLLYDSDPASEYAETEAKAGALLDALNSMD